MIYEIPPAPPRFVSPTYGRLDAFYSDYSVDHLVGVLLQLGHESADEPLDVAHQDGRATYSDCLLALHERSTQEVFEAAVGLCLDPDPSHRVIGLSMLRELGNPNEDRPKFPETWEVLRNLASTETDPDVVHWIVGVYSYMTGDEAVQVLAQYSRDPDPVIREIVAFAIAGCGSPNDDRVIEVQLRLSRDEVVQVRRFATYDFVETITANTDLIRDTLAELLADDDEMVREDANTAFQWRSEILE